MAAEEEIAGGHAANGVFIVMWEVSFLTIKREAVLIGSIYQRWGLDSNIFTTELFKTIC